MQSEGAFLESVIEVLGVSGGDDGGAGRELDSIEQPGHVRQRVGRAHRLQRHGLLLHHALRLQRGRELRLAELRLG